MGNNKPSNAIVKNESLAKQLEYAKEKARTLNAAAKQLTMFAKKKNAGKSERALPGKEKALNRRMDQTTEQQRKNAVEAAKLANSLVKQTMREIHRNNSASFFSKKKNNKSASYHPKIHKK